MRAEFSPNIAGMNGMPVPRPPEYNPLSPAIQKYAQTEHVDRSKLSTHRLTFNSLIGLKRVLTNVISRPKATEGIAKLIESQFIPPELLNQLADVLPTDEKALLELLESSIKGDAHELSTYMLLNTGFNALQAGYLTSLTPQAGTEAYISATAMGTTIAITEGIEDHQINRLRRHTALVGIFLDSIVNNNSSAVSRLSLPSMEKIAGENFNHLQVKVESLSLFLRSVAVSIGSIAHVANEQSDPFALDKLLRQIYSISAVWGMFGVYDAGLRKAFVPGYKKRENRQQHQFAATDLLMKSDIPEYSEAILHSTLNLIEDHIRRIMPRNIGQHFIEQNARILLTRIPLPGAIVVLSGLIRDLMQLAELRGTSTAYAEEKMRANIIWLQKLTNALQNEQALYAEDAQQFRYDEKGNLLIDKFRRKDGEEIQIPGSQVSKKGITIIMGESGKGKTSLLSHLKRSEDGKFIEACTDRSKRLFFPAVTLALDLSEGQTPLLTEKVIRRLKKAHSPVGNAIATYLLSEGAHLVNDESKYAGRQLDRFIEKVLQSIVDESKVVEFDPHEVAMLKGIQDYVHILIPSRKIADLFVDPRAGWSDGECRRYEILRALTKKNRSPLLDEPTSNLDEKNIVKIKKEILRCLKNGSGQVVLTLQPQVLNEILQDPELSPYVSSIINVGMK